MTTALWQDFSLLALSEIAIMAVLFGIGLVKTRDEQQPSVSYSIIVALGLVGLGMRAYDHGAYSATYAFATAVGISLAIVLAGLGTARSSLIAGATLAALPHKACPILWPPTDGGIFVVSYIAALAALLGVSLLLRYMLKAKVGMNLYRISALSALAAYLGVVPL
ncbi:MAG: hypothetical protein F4X75_12170 [Gemmatimonadetes bacterium]|nr:hypothetical protein [Gemmatimonadota bacterium]